MKCANCGCYVSDHQPITLACPIIKGNIMTGYSKTLIFKKKIF